MIAWIVTGVVGLGLLLWWEVRRRITKDEHIKDLRDALVERDAAAVLDDLFGGLSEAHKGGDKN